MTPERAVAFPGGGGDVLVGVLTDPEGEGRDPGLVLLQGGGVPAPNHGRAWVTIARAAAARGHAALRFDYHGVGESGGFVTRFDLGDPFVEDVAAAARARREAGAGALALVGACFGARSALAAAASGAAEPVAGVLALDLPLSGGAIGSGDGGGETADEVVDEVARLAATGVRLTIVYGNEDDAYASVGPAAARLERALGAAGELVVLEGFALHGLASERVQRRVADLVLDWLESLAA